MQNGYSHPFTPTNFPASNCISQLAFVTSPLATSCLLFFIQVELLSAHDHQNESFANVSIRIWAMVKTWFYSLKGEGYPSRRGLIYSLEGFPIMAACPYQVYHVVTMALMAHIKYGTQIISTHCFLGPSSKAEDSGCIHGA
jgi:hypothetical protein